MPNCVFCDNENQATFTQCQDCGAPLPVGSARQLDDATFQSHLRALLARGEKIKAVAAYRRWSGAGLAEAVKAIDGLDNDQEFAVTYSISDVEREIGKLLERGEKINAIKTYRERTGVGLKEAKDEVEALEVRLGLAPEEGDQKTGCAGLILILGASSIWGAMSIVLF